MRDREDKVADVAGQIEMLLQKWERKLNARTQRDYQHQRTLLTAAVYELADTIVNGQRAGWLKRLMARLRLRKSAKKSRR